jgi:hypothetical protein
VCFFSQDLVARQGFTKDGDQRAVAWEEHTVEFATLRRLAMLKAVLRKGLIVPLEPVPPEWEEGAALKIEKAENMALDFDAWAKSLNELSADSTTEDEDLLRRAVAEHRRQASAR